MRLIRTILTGILLASCSIEPMRVQTGTAAEDGRQALGWTTNGPAVFGTFTTPRQPAPILTNSEGEILRGPVARPLLITNRVFDHFIPGSLNNLIWTNAIAHTNGRSVAVWSQRSHPPGWPTNPPVAVWNRNSLIWGMKGLTALSPCWQVESAQGQVPVTALTRRHGYTRGHGMGPDGFRTDLAGKKVWFFTADNRLVQATVARMVVRTSGEAGRDYTILLFNQDLPWSIQPMRVATNVLAKYPPVQGAPWPLYQTEQGGGVSAGMPGITLDTFKGGDSGSPNMLPMPGELVFIGGRSTTGPTAAMQADMDELCRQQGLNPNLYQMQWYDLSKFPSYPQK